VDAEKEKLTRAKEKLTKIQESIAAFRQ